jgi:hypothetical protein
MDITKVNDQKFTVAKEAEVYDIGTIKANIAQYQGYVDYWQAMLDGAVEKGCKLEVVAEEVLEK